MTTPQPGLPDEVRDLLTAIRDALDVPAAEASNDQAQEQYTRLVQLRVANLRGVLDGTLEYRDPNLGVIVDVVRRGITDHPVTYQVHTPDTGTTTNTG